MDERVYEFGVALSFAGEDRAHAEGLAKLLRDSDVRVFYDEFGDFLRKPALRKFARRDREFADSPLEGAGFELVWGFPVK
jgi:hypothetical protein